MSLPKRDGVNGRYYLIYKPDTDPEVLEHADQCIQDMLDGTAKENHSGSPMVVRNQSGTHFLPSQLLDRYLSTLPLKGFPYDEAVVFCDALRRLVGWTLLCFICYVAVCYTVYGASYSTVTTEHYLNLVSQLHPDMVKQLKSGGGKVIKAVPKELREKYQQIFA